MGMHQGGEECADNECKRPPLDQNRGVTYNQIEVNFMFFCAEPVLCFLAPKIELLSLIINQMENLIK